MFKAPVTLFVTLTLILGGCNSLNTQPQPGVPENTTSVQTHGNAKSQQKAVQVLTKKERLPIQPPTSAATTPTYTNVWEKIGNNLVLTRNLHQKRVKNKLAWFSRNQDYLDRVSKRAQPYLHYIVEQLEQRNMPLDLALLPIVESAYHPFAYSPSHASGIWQFIPGTGKQYGLKQNWWYDGRRDIVASTRAAMDYLEKLHKEFNGDWLLALAAYNSGERNVARAIKRNRRAGKKTDFWSLRLPRETRQYVPNLLAIAELVARPAKYGVQWRPIGNKPYLAKITTSEQLDLAIVAELANLSIEEVYTLNPGFNRWATDPAGPHELVLPLEKKEAFEKKLAALPADKKISWKRHIIKQGETLSHIADRHHLAINTLKQANNLRGNLIRTGQSLLIPSAQRPLQHYTLSMDARRYRGLKRSGDGQKYIYRVRKGDTLWDIGRQYAVSIKQLCAWNNISARSLLRPGQKLNLWFDNNNQKGKLLSASIKNAPGKYTVKKGDSLWLIARRFGTTVNKLIQWNNLSREKHLQPGQELILNPLAQAKGA